MPGFFKSLLGKHSEAPPSPTPSQQPASISYEQIESMPLHKVSALIKDLPPTMTAGTITALIRRFLGIGLLDNHVSDEDRSAALKLAQTLTADFETSFSNLPNAIAALKAANDEMFAIARSAGYGSLVWRLKEDSVSGPDTIPYVMKPEHRHLIPDFLRVIGPEATQNAKRHMVRQMVLQHSYSGYNAVIILHGLVAKGDKAAVALFTPEECNALLNVPANYDAGRRVLVAVNLLPAVGGAIPFKPVTDLQRLILFVLQTCKDASEADPRLVGLNEDHKYCLLVALTFLRVQLATAHLQQIFGEAAGSTVAAIFSNEIVQKALVHFDDVSRALSTSPPGTPVDLALLDSVMRIGGVAPQSENEWKTLQGYIQMGTEWLNQERVSFQCYLRYMLRASVSRPPEALTTFDERTQSFLRDLYFRKGARIPVAEWDTYFEDWIGTDET